jgi:dCTP diphosphatase
MHQGEFEDLTRTLRDFAAERNWSEFHSPKNLAMAVGAEVGELLAEFRWLTEDQSLLNNMSLDKRKSIELEIADIQILLLQLADHLELDIPTAVREKIDINRSRHWETDGIQQ